MNNLGKTGAVLVIIGSALEIIGAIIALSVSSLLSFIPILGPVLIILRLIVFGLTVTVIILSSLTLAKKKNLRIVSGILALIVIVFGWITGLIFWILSAIIFIVGAILLFIGKDKNVEMEEGTITGSEASSVFGTKIEA